MTLPRRPRNRREKLPEVVEQLLAGGEIENTKENKRVLVDVIYFREYSDVIDEATRKRASSTLWKWGEPEREAQWKAYLAHHAEIIKRRDGQ